MAAAGEVEVLGLPPEVPDELLVLYFENRRRSGGGPVQSWRRRGSRARLAFESPDGEPRGGGAEGPGRPPAPPSLPPTLPRQTPQPGEGGGGGRRGQRLLLLPLLLRPLSRPVSPPQTRRGSCPEGEATPCRRLG